MHICLGDSKRNYDARRELKRNDEISFQKVYGHRESVNIRLRGMLITYFL